MTRMLVRERLERFVILSLIVACCLAAPLSTLAEDGGTPTAGQDVPPADPVVTEESPVEPPVEVISTEPPPVTPEPPTPTVEIAPTEIVATEPAPTQPGDPTVPASEAPITPDDLSCAPTGETTGSPGTAFAFDCTLQAGSDRSGTVLTLDLAFTGDGWLVAVDGPVTVEFQVANPLAVPVPLAQAAGDTLTFSIAIQSPDDLATIPTSNATLTLGAARIAPDQTGPDATSVQTTMAVAVTAETTLAPEAGVMRIGADPQISCTADDRRTPSPLGWDQGVIYQCVFSRFPAPTSSYTTIRITLDYPAYQGGWAVSAPTPSPPDKPTTRRSDQGSATITCCSFFVAIWSPVEPSEVTRATGFITVQEFGGRERSVSVPFEVTVGESSMQTPTAAFTCLNATNAPTNTIQPSVPLNLACTLAALNGDVSLGLLQFTLPAGVRLNHYTDGGRGILRQWSPGRWEYTPLNGTVSPDTPLVLNLTLDSERCDISASQLPLSFQLLVDDTMLELNTTLATTATSPAAVDFTSLSSHAGDVPWSATGGALLTASPSITIQPPSCLAPGSSQQLSLSIAGAGSNFQTTSSGQLPLSDLMLLSVITPEPGGPVQAIQPTGPTTLTANPAIATITGTGASPAILIIDLALQLPAGLPPGTYWATITVNISGGEN